MERSINGGILSQEEDGSRVDPAAWTTYADRMLMRRCRLVLVFVVITVATSSAQTSPAAAPNPFGEPARTSTNHLTVESTLSHSTVAPGTRVTMSVNVVPRR